MFDSHCHLDFSSFDADRPQLIDACVRQGIGHILIPATDVAGFERIMQLYHAYPQQLSFALGLHPWWLTDDTQPIAQLAEWLARKPSGLVAVGECGLDFAIDGANKTRQLAVLEQQFELAVAYQLPVILHVRKAHNELLRLLKAYPSIRGVVHAFSGSLKLAEQYLERNLYLGVGGSITYLRANKTRHTIANVPLSALLLETDAPDMPLSGFQGLRNSPLQVAHIAKTLAELKQLPVANIVAQTNENGAQLFGIQINSR